MLLLVALWGCTTGSSDVITNPTSSAPALAVDADAAFDPLRAPLGWSVSGPPGASVTLTARQQDADLWSTTGTLDASGALAGEWDASGSPPAAGPLTLDVTDGDRTATDESVAVRPGFVEARFDSGDQATRQLLYWRGGETLQDLAAPVSTTADLAHFPTVSDDVIRPPEDGSAEPVAYAYDSRPRLTLTAPTGSELGGTGLEDAAIEVSIEGWTAVGSAQLAPGAAVTLQADAPLADTVGISDLELTLRFTAADADRVIEVGTQELPVRIYRVLGPHTTGFHSPDGNPWLAAIDPALRAIEGTPAEHGAIADALVDWIYNDLGLVYDTNAGASFYSDYTWYQWDEPVFYLSDFLIRRNGNVINCSDSGNILATHANMLGAELMHIVILENYNLNEIKGIGLAGFSSCPFGPWGCGFSYHAVTTDDPSGATVWDTTLALDGDNNPGASPSAELLVQSIPGPEYLSRLVRSGNAQYAYPGQVHYE